MKTIFKFLFPLLLIAAVSSCASKSDIDDLQEQIDNLKTGKIATIEQQLTGIQASITSLQATDTQLSSFVSTLQLETSGIRADLS